MPGTRSATSTDAYIGQKLRGYRNQQRLSQSELGELVGVTFQQIQKYENGVNRLSGSRLEQLAQIFDVAVADFLPPRSGDASKKKLKLSSVDRVMATRDGSQLIDIFANIKNKNFRAAVVELASRFQGQ